MFVCTSLVQDTVVTQNIQLNEIAETTSALCITYSYLFSRGYVIFIMFRLYLTDKIEVYGDKNSSVPLVYVVVNSNKYSLIKSWLRSITEVRGAENHYLALVYISFTV